MSRVSVEATCFTPQQLPPADVPEVVMAGRSNVGKSSLINALLGAKLAHVGGTPGKTRSVNFYRVEDGDVEHKKVFRVVDLPGYGYASRSKGERNEWLKLVSAYMRSRAEGPEQGGGFVCHLVDFRHGLLANDRELQEWLNGYGAPILVVFTKADKVPKGQWRGKVEQYVRDGLYSLDLPIVTSAEKKTGIDKLKAFIERTLYS
ncbi:MAG: ribosome biogenesis GTP-binding protein YsxC [Synergistaceae bacterium]|nr:ribosome biogenesis GTP-binding protein YsxC [Synergistaceae bacterium]